MTTGRVYKIIIATFWLTIICVAFYLFLTSGLDFSHLLREVEALIRTSGPWAPLVYIVFYSFRSLLFFPASVLTVTAGILFGPWLGLIFTVIGENISANFSYLVSRYFMQDFDRYLDSKNRFFNKTFCHSRKNGFLTVLIMRLSFVPFDLVSYFAGMCNIRQRQFALGTFLGTIPGLLTFTLLGSSVRDVTLLFVGITTLIISLLIAFILKKTDLTLVF